MTKTRTKKKFVLASLFTVSLLAMLAVTRQQISAEETEKKQQYTRANYVSIHTVFTFRDAIEESDGFQIYEQVSGFDRVSDSPVFKLKGAVNYERMYLYEAVDMTYHRGLNTIQHDYGQFDVDVYLQKDGTTFRHFEYSDCNILDYKVTTLFDKEEGWTTSKGFATIDEFEFECNGYQPHNPLFDLMNAYSYKASTKNSIDLRDAQTWSEEYR